jgi:hypothetical protein
LKQNYLSKFKERFEPFPKKRNLEFDSSKF